MGKVTIIVEADISTKDLETICSEPSWLRVLEVRVENKCGSTPGIFIVPADDMG